VEKGLGEKKKKKEFAFWAKNKAPFMGLGREGYLEKLCVGVNSIPFK